MRTNATSSVPEWRRPTDQPDPNPRQRRTSTREGNRGNRGGRGRGRGGNGGGPPRKDSTTEPQDATSPAPKVVVDPPSVTDTPAELPSTPRPNSRPRSAKRNSATASEDSTSASSQTSARPPNRRRRSQQGRQPTLPSNNAGKLLNVQTLSRKASSEPSSPNSAKDLPPHLDPVVPATPTTELKSDIDAFVQRVRSVAMDRPRTPGSHIDWADDDDSLPDLNDWGYTGEVAAPAKPEEPSTTIPPILEDTPLETGTVIPEVKVEGEGEPSPVEIKSQDAERGPASDTTPRTHKVQKTRSKRGTRLRGNSRTQPPPALNLPDSVTQGPSLSPTQPTSATVTPHTSKHQGPKRQNPNQGQNSRNNQSQRNYRDNGNGGGHQRGQNGAAVASPMRNSFPAKSGPKAEHTPIQSQPPAQSPIIAHPVNNPSTELASTPAESKVDTAPNDEGKRREPSEPRNAGAIDSNPHPIATNDTHELELNRGDLKPKSSSNQRKRNSYNPSHSRSHTYGGRTQGGPQPPHSASTPTFPHHSSNANSTSRNPRPPNSRQSPGMRPSGLGPAPNSAGYERHNRNHSSPPGVGGATRPPHLSRPVLTGGALDLLAKSLGSAPGSPKKDPPVPQTAS